MGRIRRSHAQAPRPEALAGWQRWRHAASALLPSMAVAIVSALALGRSGAWYDALTLPSFAPPGWGLGPAAAAIDLLIAVAFHRVLRQPDWMPDRPHATRGFIVQLGLSLAWPLAVLAHSPTVALLLILALLATLVAMARRFGRIDRDAGLWTMLGGAGIAFLALVTLSIVIRN